MNPKLVVYGILNHKRVKPYKKFIRNNWDGMDDFQPFKTSLTYLLNWSNQLLTTQTKYNPLKKLN